MSVEHCIALQAVTLSVTFLACAGWAGDVPVVSTNSLHRSRSYSVMDCR